MLKAVLKFARVRIIVTCYALAYLGSVASGDITLKTVLSVFIILAWYIHAATTNDFADKEIDKINLKGSTDRPLLTNEISAKQFWFIHIASGMVALILASFYGTVAIIATLGMLITDYLYSLKPVRISDRGIVSQLVLAVGYVYFPFSLGYWATDMSEGYPWLLSVGLYLAFVARILLKDFRDVKGDKKHGKMTFLLRHGVSKTCIVSGAFWLSALLAMGLAITFELGAMIALILGFAYVCVLLKALSKSEGTENQQKIIALIAKTANISVIVVLALLLCKDQTGLSSWEQTLIPLAIGIALLFLIVVRHRALLDSRM